MSTVGDVWLWIYSVGGVYDYYYGLCDLAYDAPALFDYIIKTKIEARDEFDPIKALICPEIIENKTALWKIPSEYKNGQDESTVGESPTSTLNVSKRKRRKKRKKRKKRVGESSVAVKKRVVPQSPANLPTPTLDDIIDLEEGKGGIREILDRHFRALGGYSNINILWKAAQNSLPMFLNDNAINTVDDLWILMQCVFGREYVLSEPHIWQSAPNHPKSNHGLCVNLARQHGGLLTREQIDSYFSQTGLHYDSVTQLLDIKNQNVFLQYNGGEYLLTENIKIKQSPVVAALNALFAEEDVLYVIPRDISAAWFADLPGLPLELPWTPLFLQEILRVRPQTGYRVISSQLKGQTLDTVGAAIVPDTSVITTFADVVHLFCCKVYKLPHRLPSEDLRLALRGAGMIDGGELMYNLHKALDDYRFAFSNDNRTVMIRE